jgi:sporulation protein YlmC with PRC-barrel domain
MSPQLPNKLTGQLDGAFELLDRQLLDDEGRMLGKVDDVELTQTDEGLTVTAVLSGQVALLHRLGGRLGNQLATKYVLLRPSEKDRSRPWRIPMADVARLDSALHLRGHRDGSLRRDRETYRLGTLTGMDVTHTDGKRVGRVLDARFTCADTGHLVLSGLVIGHGHPGSLLGYDRWTHMGPWLVRRTVGWLHRHTVLVDAEHAHIMWNNEEVRLISRLDHISRSALR